MKHFGPPKFLGWLRHCVYHSVFKRSDIYLGAQPVQEVIAHMLCSHGCPQGGPKQAFALPRNSN